MPNMKIRWTVFLGAIAVFVSLASMAYATPSSTYWTPMTLDIQSYKVFHITYDSYFTVFRDASDGSGDFPTDYGLTVGILPFDKVQMEVGIDFFEPSDHPFFFNAKIGTPADALFEGSPAIQLGIFNVGTESGITNQNIVHLIVGKAFPNVGRISAGPYVGNGDVLVNSEGEEENSGFEIAFDRGFMPAKDSAGNEFNRLVFATDYATGDNAFGGGGFGVSYFFTKDISLLTGPVWFNDEGINGKWKWTLQLDINLPKIGE